MIGLLIVMILFLYISISVFIIKSSNKVFPTKKATYIVTAIMILIPIGDMILVYPIYKYLCATKAGANIYQEVENIAGFYIGEQSNKLEPFIPNSKYDFVDYKEQESGKYYRSYWLNNNTSELCVSPPSTVYKFNKYSKTFKEGRCIAKEEISDNKVSEWEVRSVSNRRYDIFSSYIHLSEHMIIKNRSTNEIIGEYKNFSWQIGWVWKIFSSIETGHTGYIECDIYKERESLIYQVLKQGKDNDNN